jgi:hypothetical protein
MALVFRRSLRVLVAAGLLVVCPALIVSLPASTASLTSCETLRQWAQQYRGTSPTLEKVATYDRAHRVAIFNVIAPEVRAALWQDHIRRFARRADLSITQRALVVEGEALTTPALYQHDAIAAAAFTAFWRRADAAFAARDLRREWFDLSPATGPVSTKATPSFFDRLVSPFHAQAKGDVSCECNTNWGGFDCAGGGCIAGGCTWLAVGCGPNWQTWCNGMCG